MKEELKFLSLEKVPTLASKFPSGVWQFVLEKDNSCRILCHSAFVGSVLHFNAQDVVRCRTRGESEESVVCRRGSMQVRDSPWLWITGQTSPEVQSRGISGPTKKTCVLQKLKRKRKEKKSPNGKVPKCFTHNTEIAIKSQKHLMPKL